MSTTSLKLTSELKRRAAAAAKRSGITPHAFMVEAIGRAADAAERRAEVVSAAVAARKSAVRSAKGYAADEVHAYIKQRLASRKAARPKVRSWRG